jgi:ribosomal protein L13
MPSPAAGKGDTPRTPTKLGRKPQQSAPKLGKGAKSQSSPTETPDTGKAEQNLPEKAQDASEDVKDKGEQAEGTAEDTAEDTTGKVSQAGDDLQQQDPKPIDEAEDTAEDAKEQAEDTAGGAEDDAEETADDATQKAGDEAGDEADTNDNTEDDATDTAENGEQETKGALSGARGLAGRASNLAGKGSKDPSGAAQEAGEDAQDTAEEAADDAQDTAGEATDKAQSTVDGAEEGAEDAAGEATDKAQSTVDRAEEGAEDAAGDAEDAAGDAEDATGDVKDSVEDTAGQPDLSVLKGLEVDEEGLIKDKDGNAIGRLVEGDAEDLAGYAIGDDGEILDDDGDLVGRCELTPETAEKQAADAKGEADSKMPDISVLKGLTADKTGQILNEDGDFIGRLVEGDPSEIEGMEFNEKGEIVDEDGNVIARAELHPDAAEVLGQGEDEEEGEGEGDEEEEGEGDVADGVADEAGEAAEGAQETGSAVVDENGEPLEEELPGVEALEGMQVNSEGEIVNDDGDVVGQLAEGELDDVKGLTVNDKGEVVDADGNVLGRVELAEGAADKLKEAAAGALDIRILEGLKVNKKGKVLDAEGEEIGELKEGEVSDCAGKTVNDKGEVLDKDGNVLGKVDVVSGEAAFEAMKALKEQLGEQEPEVKEVEVFADMEELEGLRVNKKGQVLNEDGEPVAELVEGEIKDCAGKKLNDKGEVVDKDGNVLGKVKALPQIVEQPVEEEQEEEPEMEEVEVTPEIDTLEGLKVNKKGQVLNEDGEPIGELIEGDVKDCAGKKINEKGEVLDKDGNVIGKVKALPQIIEQKVGEAEDAAEDAEGAAEEAGEAAEDAQEAAEEAGEEGEEGEGEGEEGEDATQLPPLSVLEGLKVNKSGKLIDANGTIVGELIEGDAKKLSKSGVQCDAEGQFWDNKGHVIGRAQTVAVEDAEEESPFAGLEGLIVVKDGFVEDENGNRVGKVVEGDAKKLVGRAVDEDGDILDKKGSVVGHAERYEEPEEEAEPEPEAIDLSDLEGRTVNKAGNVIGDEGVPVARLIEGNAKELAGRKLDDQGQIWNDSGKVIGRVELIPENEREAKPEGPFAGLRGLRVIADGKVADEDENVVGVVVEGNAKRLVGNEVDEDGDILDKHGNVKGHAEPLEEEEEIPDDLSILDGLTLNKQGYLVDANGIPVGRLVEGNVKELAGRKSDGEGLIHSDTGKVAGRCELIPAGERPERAEGPFAGFEGLRVVKDGFVEDNDGNRVGQITEGDPKKLVGHAVDEDGDILDKHGNVKGHAEPYEEPEEEEVDLSALAGCTVNKAGNVVDSSGQILGRVAEGDPSTMIGKKVDGKGQIWDNAGNVIGRAELVQGASSGPEGPFAGFDDNSVQKDGTVQTPAGDIIGRVIEGDVKKLVGHKVDEDGDINDKNGNVIGKAERWEPEEKERRINPMAGMRVNKEGEVRDENGDLMGRLTAGDLGHCAGLEIDDNGYVVDNDGNKVGEVTLLENIQEEEEPEDETEEEKKRREDAELAEKMANICQQTLERVQPVMKQITEYIEQADRTPRDELDEEELVNNVKPLIEEGGRILQECNGSLRGLDPDGRIAAQAKGRAETREATPEEYRLADLLKEITTSVVTTIDNAKKKISDMPHAKKKLNPLWALLTEPLFQIIAAVGLLLTGVLNLVGRLLNGLGLGGLVNGLLGGLGINKLLGGLGLGSISDMLGGGKKDKKKGGGAKNLPIVGGMLGGK